MDNVLALNVHILPSPTRCFEEFRPPNQVAMSFQSGPLDHSPQSVQTREI
jgi:hypothetical protein